MVGHSDSGHQGEQASVLLVLHPNKLYYEIIKSGLREMREKKLLTVLPTHT